MATILLPTDFKDFLRLLNENRVEYLLVGGYAVGYYGYPRATGDLDIWIDTGLENAARVVAALQAFGFASTAPSPEMFSQPDLVIRMGNPPLRIELLTGISGVGFQECWAVRETPILDGVPVNIITLDNLKANKKASGRLKDLNDLDNLPCHYFMAVSSRPLPKTP